MSTEQHMSTDTILARLRETFQGNRSTVVELMEQQKTLQGFIHMLRFMMSTAPMPDESTKGGQRLILEQVDQLGKHLETTLNLLMAYHGMAMTLNAVMSEHEEEVKELDI